MPASLHSPWRRRRPAAVAAVLALLLAAVPPAFASKALAMKYGCLGCHAVATQLVGPPYQAVAEKYADQPDAAAMLAARIRSGGSGKWGELVMPPQPQVSEADLKKLAAWVLGGAK